MKRALSLIILSLTIPFMTVHGAEYSTEAGAQKLIEFQMQHSQAWDHVAHLADQIGARPSGSENAAEAIRWAKETLESWGLDEVRFEPVTVPRWVRGEERARLTSHLDQPIILTTLGRSVATPAEGIEAEVVEVSSLDEVDQLGESVRGKIVLYNVPMDINLVESGDAFAAYSRAVPARGAGADRAAKHGAVAALVRSMASASLRTPHTGAMRYGGDVPKIPAAAVTTEDADLIHRLIERGERVRMHLVLTPRTMPEVESANVIAELRGRELPDEIVVIGGHIDSWDLGTGAIDNGAGVAGTMEAMRAMAALEMRPRRTVRLVLFMNEEMGLSGAVQYFKDHEDELENHFATLESDSGATEPTGFRTTLNQEQIESLGGLFEPLAGLGANMFVTGSPAVGADTSPLSKAGVPGFGLMPDSRHYFDYHHSPADTLDKIDPDELRKNAAAVAAMTWILADTAVESLR
ncbi:MAG: M20/M25/M40 family metallo-hydrolase [Acidobacteria bacterium]|nr:M20/M25/M40 family metallo-hydrolase [Acidobacteriota bacterium]